MLNMMRSCDMSGCSRTCSSKNILESHSFASKVFMLRPGILIRSKLLQQPHDVSVALLSGGMSCSPASQHSIIDVHSLCDQPTHRVSSEKYLILRTSICEKMALGNCLVISSNMFVIMYGCSLFSLPWSKPGINLVPCFNYTNLAIPAILGCCHERCPTTRKGRFEKAG